MIREALTFSDVLLVPKYSEIKSRKDVDLSVNLKNFWFAHPLIGANMRSISGEEFVQAEIDNQGLAILHRFMSLEEQVRILRSTRINSTLLTLGVSIGVKEEDRHAFDTLFNNGARLFCIDIAHGDSKGAVDMLEWLQWQPREITVIAGNVATADGAKRLWDAGADAVKVGVGPASICTTRIETGNGVPQFTALMDVALEAEGRFVIADGGLTSAGDCVKSLCFANMCMSGALFAGCTEAPSNVFTIDGKSYKEYVGSSTHRTTNIEGVKAMVPIKGSFSSILQRLEDGIRSGCSYQGVSKVGDLKKNPEFIRMTAAGIRESGHHDVLVG